MAIASVSLTDTKNNSSDYGPEVSICAPRENIYGTVLIHMVICQGLAIATPIVSSAAALLKAKFCSWTMKQVGERLKATADNINGKTTDTKACWALVD